MIVRKVAKPIQWSEIDSRFIKTAAGNLAIAEDVRAVMCSIDNILRTRKGERCYEPTFGSVLGGMLFEPMSSSVLTTMSETIKNDIETWDDRPLIRNISYYQNPDRNLIDLTVEFAIRGNPNVFQYKMPVRTVE